MKPRIIIDGFKNGILNDPTIPARDGFNFGAGIDIHREPGILQVSQRLDAMSQADSPNNITDTINWLVKYTGNNKMYGLGNGRIYDYDNTVSGKWALAHDDSNTGWGQGMAEFGGNLYWASNSYLGKFDGSNWTDSFQTLDTDGSWHPMVVFKNKLHVGAANYIATLDSDGTTWTQRALDLPAGYRVKSLAVYGNKLYIGTWRGSNIYDIPEAKLFSWNGSDPSFNEVWELRECGINAMIPWRNLLIVFAGISGNIYAFNGAVLRKIKQIPKINSQEGNWGQVRPGAVCEYEGNILFGWSGAGIDGIYQLGRKDDSEPLALTLSHIISSGEMSSAAIYSLYQAGTNTFWAGIHDGTNYGVDQINVSKRITSAAYWESQVYEVAFEDQPVQLKAVELVAKPIPANCSVTIKYKLDNASSWTTLGTITSSNQNRPYFGIKGTAKAIQIRLEFTTPTENNNSPEISTIKIY